MIVTLAAVPKFRCRNRTGDCYRNVLVSRSKNKPKTIVSRCGALSACSQPLATVSTMENRTDNKVSENDMILLKNHVRLVNGLPLVEEPAKSTPSSPIATKGTAWSSSVSPPKISAISDESRRYRQSIVPSARPNQTYVYRTECIKKRLRQWAETSDYEANELRRLHRLKLYNKPAESFKLNKAFHMRWKNIRGLPVVHSYFRDTYLDTGKPPFTVPVHYKPFNVYWDADWAKQEFIFLDAAAEEKKKEEAKKKEEERRKEELKKISRIMEAAPYKPKLDKETKPEDSKPVDTK